MNGNAVWKYKGVEGYVETKPLLYDNKVIFGAWDGKLYALDQRTGEEIWIRSTEGVREDLEGL